MTPCFFIVGNKLRKIFIYPLTGSQEVIGSRSKQNLTCFLYNRCFAFFHHRMPDEPLIFIEVAFTHCLSDNIQKLLDESVPPVNQEDADTVIFYSITNTQKGLTSISLGNFLIKYVIEKLSSELKNIKHFVTLSPIIKFREWLEKYLSREDITVLTPEESEIIKKNIGISEDEEGTCQLQDSEWYTDSKKCESLKAPLMKLCVYYLLREKRSQAAYDSVANFHLANGARIERINWLADISKKGIEQSMGMMANYYYDLSSIAENHDNYIKHGKVAASKEVKSLLKNKRS